MQVQSKLQTEESCVVAVSEESLMEFELPYR